MKNKIPLASLAISLLGRCNLACKTCYEKSSPTTIGEFSFDEIKKIIDAVSQVGIGHVFFAGGEPLLHPQVSEAISFAVGLGLHPNLSTNGIPINEEILQKLYSAGLTHDLSVSLDGPNQSINDSIRGRGAFVPALQGMYKLNRFGKILWGVNFVSCGLNIGHAVDTAMLAKRMGASYFNLIKITPFGRTVFFKKILVIDEETYEKEVKRVSEHFRGFGNFFDDIRLFDLVGNLQGRAVSYFDDPKFDSLPCGISVNHLGEVGLTPPNIDLGNCKNDDISVLLKKIESPEVQHLYQKWLRNEHPGIHQPPKSKIIVSV